MSKKNKYFNIPVNFSSLIFIYKELRKGKSIMRITHNYYLKNLSIYGDTADLGSGTKSDYISFFKKKKINLKNFDFYKKNNLTKKVDLEKKFNLSKKKFDNIILFNVLEHIKNHKNLLKRINLNLKNKGKFKIFVPFMFRFHGDPIDVFRPTHFYLENLLKDSGFRCSSVLIATGPLMVVLEIILRYLKFTPIKLIFIVFFLLINNIFKIFSKDFDKYYCGTHCNCTKIGKFK